MRLESNHLFIPASLESSRLPCKLLRTFGGKTVLQHTYERACAASVGFAHWPVIVTDSPEIQRLAPKMDDEGGATVLYMEGDFSNGSERIAAACSPL